jgi:CheY-like chemotaxis protein
MCPDTGSTVGQRVSTPRRVLVVDDDASCRELLRVALGNEGFIVATARDGLDALTVLRASPPDVILLDLEMPRLSGWTLHQRLAADSATSAIPVIVITGAEPRHLALQARAILPKPLNVDDVLGEVQWHLRSA